MSAGAIADIALDRRAGPVNLTHRALLGKPESFTYCCSSIRLCSRIHGRGHENGQAPRGAGSDNHQHQGCELVPVVHVSGAGVLAILKRGRLGPLSSADWVSLSHSIGGLARGVSRRRVAERAGSATTGAAANGAGHGVLSVGVEVGRVKGRPESGRFSRTNQEETPQNRLNRLDLLPWNGSSGWQRRLDPGWTGWSSNHLQPPIPTGRTLAVTAIQPIQPVFSHVPL